MVEPKQQTERGLQSAFMGPIVRIAILILIGFAGLLIYMYLKQESFVYFPDATIRATPEFVGLAYEDVRLKTRDGVALGAWWVPAANARGALVFAHGNGGNISDRLDHLRLFNALDLSVLAFDYRGYGTSEGKPGEEGTYHDMEAAVEHVVRERGVPHARLVYHGESLGGGVAVECAVRQPPGALLLESSFTCVRDMARHHYPWLPTSLLLRIRYDSIAKLSQIRCPILIVHSPDDDIVPFWMGEALFKAAHEPKRFARLVGYHNSGGLTVSPEAQEALREFLDEFLAAAQTQSDSR